jgi:hypothetical protein
MEERFQIKISKPPHKIKNNTKFAFCYFNISIEWKTKVIIKKLRKAFL